MEFRRDSDLVKFIINYVVAEILFFIGSMIIIGVKVIFSLNMTQLLEGSFLGPASNGMFAEAFSGPQLSWIQNNLLLWWINIFLAFFSSLLLIIGFFALAILLPLGVDIFSGGNPIAIEAMPVGLLFLICWGVFPTLYIIRSTWIGWVSKIKGIVSPSTN